MIVGKDICKPVPLDMKLFRELATVHEPKLLSANVRILLTDIFAIFNLTPFSRPKAPSVTCNKPAY
ncbi:hypothetical protein HMPREF9439_00483 [Parasutterella excrementihominis YIT 11859]|uniref:Uncharacterized protein n=1 Tax=Parasutterella excrementihominis YIT 11859 TaxID=762966 RepID=F3QHT6_9BURK|nr:hypothetical protein [Parasutterella excrementihominis]EGG57000.1 hypothetical protein HMPREF9439_00483 [Parasutterella excrementihominis YIT 11859]